MLGGIISIAIHYCYSGHTAPVRNMKQYLLAMLYNAPTTMNLYYQNKTNHDFARGSPKAG